MREKFRACVRACSCVKGSSRNAMQCSMLKLPRLAYAYELDFLCIQKKQVPNARLAPFFPVRFVRFHLSRCAFSLVTSPYNIVMDCSRSQSPWRPGRGGASNHQPGGFRGGNYFDWSTSFDHEDGKNEATSMQ